MGTIVDVHCHTFNAADLPVRGFVRRVHLRDNAIGDVLADLADRLLQGPAASHGNDLARLNALLGPAPALESIAAAAGQSTAGFEQEVDVALAELSGSDPELIQRLGVVVAAQEGVTAGVESPASMVQSARRAVRWVKLYGRSRLDLVAQLIGDYGDELDLITPMLVDLDTGLGDRSRTPQRDQMVLFEKLSRATMLGLLPGAGKARLHPFMCFDPLRELQSRRIGDLETPLDLVRTAILTYGFVGVKVYPPMGWRPSGNRPSALRSAEDAGELDRIVDEFAGWCATEQVPVTTHANNTQHANSAFEGFGGPEDWLPVLERHPALRLNFGHFGGGGAESNDDGWRWRIARIAASFPGVFADVGCHPVHDVATRDAYQDTLQRMFANDATRVMASRLMYGSDWYMLAINPDYERFLSRYREMLTAISADEDAFLGGNALSFLGFDTPGNFNHERLRLRYDQFAPHRTPAWLAN